MSKHFVNQRVLIQGIIRDIPAAGPYTIQLGDGRTPGHNIAIHECHIVGEDKSKPLPTGTGEKDMNQPPTRMPGPPPPAPPEDFGLTPPVVDEAPVDPEPSAS